MPQPKDPRRLYTGSEAAIYLGVDSSLVRDLCRRGRIKARQLGIDHRWIIEEAELDRYLAKPKRRGGKTLKQMRARRRHVA